MISSWVRIMMKFRGVWYTGEVLQDVLFCQCCFDKSINASQWQWHHAKVFFLGLRNINLSKTCHRIPAFSPFFQNVVQRANGITVVHYSKCVWQKTIILMCCGVSVDSSSLLARSNLPAATSAMPWQLLAASSSPSSNSSTIKLTHQASSSLDRFPAWLQKSPGSGSWEPDYIITIIKPFQILASPSSNYINRNAIHHHYY